MLFVHTTSPSNTLIVSCPLVFIAIRCFLFRLSYYFVVILSCYYFFYSDVGIRSAYTLNNFTLKDYILFLDSCSIRVTSTNSLLATVQKVLQVKTTLDIPIFCNQPDFCCQIYTQANNFYIATMNLH